MQDLTLPKSIITRLAKGVLPQNTQVQANAALAISKSAIVFVNYLASQYVPHSRPSPVLLLACNTRLTNVDSANEHTIAAGKKTIAPADVFKALEDIEFPFLKEPLEAEFASTSTPHVVTFTHYLCAHCNPRCL